MSHFIDQDGFDADFDEDDRAEYIAARRRRARALHWCSDCRGFNGPGSPCYEPEPPADDNEEES